MDFFANMFSGSDSASYGRFASFLALACLLIWVSLIVNKTGNLIDIPTNWLFVVGIPFGISKLGETIQAVKGGGNGNTGGN